MNKKIEMNEMMELSMKSHTKWMADKTVKNREEKTNFIKKNLINLMKNGQYDNAREVFGADTINAAVKLIKKFN